MIIQSLSPLQLKHDTAQPRNSGQLGAGNDTHKTTQKRESDQSVSTTDQQPKSLQAQDIDQPELTSQQPDLAEQRQISELRSRDQEVRAHELAHLAAAGSLSKGGPTFEFTLGPDGQRYAISGEVQIDTSGVPGDPAATLQKAIQIQQAALAPAQPSAQDRSVAVAAAAMAAEARAEMVALQSSENTVDTDEETSFQRNSARVNDTYSAIAEAGTQRANSLIDLVV